MEPNFPSNSRRPPRRESRDEPKEIKRVTSSEVLRRKTPLGRRMSQNLIGGDAQSVWGYVFGEVLIPAARDMIADAVTGGVERMIFGENARGSRSRSRGGYTAYNRYSSSSTLRPRDRDDDRRELSRRARARHDFDEIIIPTRIEAEETLDQLEELIDKYGTASIADLYELVGVSSNFTDRKWGWSDVGFRNSNVGVQRVRNGYLLNLPKPEPID